MSTSKNEKLLKGKDLISIGIFSALFLKNFSWTAKFTVLTINFPASL